MANDQKITVVNQHATKVVSLRIPTTDYLRFYGNAEKMGLTFSEFMQLRLYNQENENYASQALQIAQAELEKLTNERDSLLLNSTDSAKKLIQVVRQLAEAQSENERLNDLILDTENRNTDDSENVEFDRLSAENEQQKTAISEMKELIENLQKEIVSKENAYNEAAVLFIRDIDIDWGFSTSETFRTKRLEQFKKFYLNELEKRNEQSQIENETNDLPTNQQK